MSQRPRSRSNACHEGAHVPTSVVLEELFRHAPPDYVTIAWLIGSLHKRSFGLVMLLIALVGLVPGVSVFIGILLGFPALWPAPGLDDTRHLSRVGLPCA
jgi:hypothetical protein